jgi:hypothetical protein
MRRIAPVFAATALALVVATAAPAAARTSVSASPNPVNFSQTQTITGKGWPVIEFCKKRVLLRLRRSGTNFTVGHALINDNGRFVRRWMPRRSKVGGGRWRLEARLRCESGKDGSTVFVRRSVQIRIR